MHISVPCCVVHVARQQASVIICLAQSQYEIGIFFKTLFSKVHVMLPKQDDVALAPSTNEHLY